MTELEGGIIEEILVGEGDAVPKNQPLTRIDDTRFVSEYRESEQARIGIEHVSADSIVPQQGEPCYIAHVRATSNAIDYYGRRSACSPR
jgi:multidrug efflux pump subunit AcrA (membrane-fusion protein)